MGTFCRVQDCIGASHRDGLCRAHYERKRKGADMTSQLKPRLGTWRAVAEAMHGYTNAEDDRQFRAATQRIKRATTAWVKSKGR